MSRSNRLQKMEPMEARLLLKAAALTPSTAIAVMTTEIISATTVSFPTNGGRADGIA